MADLTAVQEPTQRPSLLQRASIFSRGKGLQTAEAQHLISYFVVVLIVGCDFLGLTIQNPLLPFYVTEFEDARSLDVGLATSLLAFSYALSQFIATPCFGVLSDRFGRRPLLLISSLGGCAGFVGQGFCKSFKSLCILRFVTGLFGGTRPVAVAYIGDTVAPERQPKYIGGLSLAVSMCLFLGPTLGGSMGLVNLALPCFFQAGVNGIAACIAYMYLKEPTRSTSGKAAASSSSKAPERPWKCWLVANAFVGGSIMFAITCWQTLFPILGSSRLDLDQNKIGLVMGAGGLMIAVAQFTCFVPLSTRLPLPVLGCFGILIGSAPCAIPLLDNKVWFVLLVNLMQGFGMALIMPGVTLTINLLSPPGRRGLCVSLTIMTQALMRVIAPMVAGPAYDIDLWVPFVIMLSCMVFALFLELLLILRVPILGKKKDDPLPKTVDADEERRAILENLYKVHNHLTIALDDWQVKKRNLDLGKTPKEVGFPDPSEVPKITHEQKVQLGIWMSDMLESHNYKRWPTHLESVHAMCRNAFPKIRDLDIKYRAEDIQYILQSHIMLEQRWERFVLSKSDHPVGGQDYDLEGASALEYQSRTTADEVPEDFDDMESEKQPFDDTGTGKISAV